MYNIGDRVVYGIHGVCTVAATEHRLVDRKKVEYFALEPVGQPGARFYVPTQNPAALSKLRPLMTAAELEALLSSPDARQDCWIPDENRRKMYYKELINSGDRAALLSMVGCLCRHKEQQTAQGRKFHLADDNFLRDARRVLESEIALVLELDATEVRDYLTQRLCV